jgi:putative transposase
MAVPAAKREAVAHPQDDHQMSERRACKLIKSDRKIVRCRSIRPPETTLRTRLQHLVNNRRKFGYWRLFAVLRRDGEVSDISRIYRLYCEEGLGVCRRTGRKRAVGMRAAILVEARPNARWSLDFV